MVLVAPWCIIRLEVVSMALAGKPQDVVRVVIPPSKAGGGICRVVKLADGSGRVERWDGNAWVPGGADGAEMMVAPPASAADLERFGVTSS